MAAAVQRKRPNREIRTLVCCEICISRAGFCLVESNETSVFLAVSPKQGCSEKCASGWITGHHGIHVLLHFGHSVLHCNVLFSTNNSPLVHVMLRVVQPDPDLHGVPLPDPVEDVLHGCSASCPPHYRDLQQTVVSLLTTTAVRTVFFLSDQNRCCSCGAIELQQSAAHILII